MYIIRIFFTDVINLKTVPALEIVLPSTSTSITYQDTNLSNTDNIASVESKNYSLTVATT